VQRDIDKLKPLIPAMEAERATRPMWTSGALPWDEPLAIPQVYNARQHEALRFDKAAKVLLLCETAATAWAPHKLGALHATMRIEPALFGITGFDRPALARLLAVRPTLLTDLRDALGQRYAVLFEDMADQEGVSYRLAWRVRDWLVANCPGEALGPVTILPGREGKRRFVVSRREIIDGPSVPPGAPDPYEPPGYTPAGP
jgi:hypothetical protein